MSFVGVDFNPTHIVAARALAESARLANVHFVEASFDDLLEPRFADLGEFDIIALHGIYSWVAPSVRRAIVKFADAKLKTGGALYVSYNTAPGWMPRAPLQRLIFEYAKRHPADLGPRPRMPCASPKPSKTPARSTSSSILKSAPFWKRWKERTSRTSFTKISTKAGARSIMPTWLPTSRPRD